MDSDRARDQEPDLMGGPEPDDEQADVMGGPDPDQDSDVMDKPRSGQNHSSR